MNIFNSIDKSKASKVLLTSTLVGLAAGLSYLLTHLSPEAFGTLAAPIAVAITLSLGALKKYALPADAPDFTTPSVGLQGLRGEVPAEKLEVKAGKVVQAVADHLEADKEEK